MIFYLRNNDADRDVQPWGNDENEGRIYNTKIEELYIKLGTAVITTVLKNVCHATQFTPRGRGTWSIFLRVNRTTSPKEIGYEA